MAAYVRSVKPLLTAWLGKARGHAVQPKRYARGLRRTPVKVLFPETHREAAAAPPRPVSRTRSGPGPGPGPGPPPPAAGTTTTTRGKTSTAPAVIPISDVSSSQSNVPVSKDRVGGLRFETAFPGDKRLARVVTIARSRTFREHQGKVLVEGRRLICDALAAGANPQMVFFSRAERLCELPLDRLKRATLVKVKFEEIKIWSELVAPQGVIAIFSRPDPERLTFPQTRHTVPLSLICDNIRDPGNMGTILRSAAAAGCQDVLLTKGKAKGHAVTKGIDFKRTVNDKLSKLCILCPIGCVDAWEPKVLRAAMGAHFRLPIYTSLDWKDIESHLPEPVCVHVADNYCGPGIVEEDENGRHHAEVNASNKPLKAGDYGWVSARRGQKDVAYEEYDTDSDSDDDAEAAVRSLPRVDAQLYHERWAHQPAALVIGGETHGLSLESVELAEKTAGRRLQIPMMSGVDSLNSAMAASIILFEGRRQMLNSLETSGRKGMGKVKLERRLT
ncbi:rRNA methyltransferase 3, mitochondrial [Merluccius polli]|uniref:rRNA methyltransferase 3, mitochondrial n=1 Tax=Merluccius polli TaxID=89951 RepID=A0AA47MG46_MERPO|nr:rRNA methyltransferase 3, mitochondrial [Merluccius polli]